MTRKESLADLQRIPGVGKSIAQDLYNIGIRQVADLQNKDAETLYKQSCRLAGVQIDRCLLYVYRCAIYFASHKQHKPELLQWWQWKDAQ